jgi:hypothetical protein
MIQKGEQNPVLRIFLSHAMGDRAYAHKLLNLLSQRANVRVFTPEKLSAGEDWQSTLKEELSNCDIFLVLLSPNSVGSSWVLHELGAAWAMNKLIIPIITHPEVASRIPLALAQYEFVEMGDLEQPDFINQILARFEETAASHHGR